MELWDEIILESMRAPNIDIRALRDPYYKDKMKKKLGRTKEERDEKLMEMEKFKNEAIKVYEEEGKIE